jgi:putative ABC transport system ATP-binding protein
MIRTNNVHFEYGTRSFSFPDFELQAGASLLISGPSGCGKTTFLHLLAGLLTPSLGNLWIGDVAINKLSERKRDRFRGKNSASIQ